MSPVAIPELSDQTTDAALRAALSQVESKPTNAKTLTPGRKQRLRELLKPQANGEQDTW